MRSAFRSLKLRKTAALCLRSSAAGWTFTTYQSRVRFRNGVVGVVASRIPPEKLSAGGYKRYTDCYIDIGLHSKEEVLKYVDVGDVACYEGPYTELAPGYITAKAIDDRVGCYMLLAAMMNVKKPKNDVYLAFTVQEEVGTRGGQVTAQRIQPDIGVAVDVTPCHDRPAIWRAATRSTTASPSKSPTPVPSATKAL